MMTDMFYIVWFYVCFVLSVLLYYNCCFIIIYMYCPILIWTCWIWDKYNTVQIAYSYTYLK